MNKPPSQQNNLGEQLSRAVALHKAQALPEAAKLYQAILDEHPNQPDALHLLGVIANQTQQFTSAKILIEQAITIDPSQALYHSNLGMSYEGLRQWSVAELHYRKAITLSENFVDALNNLASLLYRQERADEALQFLERVVAIEPNHIAALCNLGKYYDNLQSAERAYPYYRKAYVIAPDNPQVLCRYSACLVNNLRWDELLTVQQKLQQHCWQAIHSQAFLDFDHYHALHLIEDNELLHQVTQMVCKQSAARSNIRFQHTPAHRKTLTIGYLSPDFNAHTVGFLLHDLLHYHDRQEFSVIGFDLSGITDQYHEVIAQSCDKMMILNGMSSEAAADCIRAHDIDILIDLAGLTHRAKPEILAQKPSPIQCHFLGDYGTLGASYYDYYLTTDIECPSEFKRYFTERLAYLDIPFARSRFQCPELPMKEIYGLPDDRFIFCCFNHHRRIEPRVFMNWMRILKNTPDSVLWLQAETNTVKKQLIYYAQQHGLANRLIFMDKTRISEHWPIRHADCYLDTRILAGGTVSFMAGHIGLPVVTHLGETPQSRYGAALASAQNQSELVANDDNHYVDIASHLANDKNYYQQLRNQIANHQTQNRLFKPENFMHDLEVLYKKMWSCHLQQIQPDTIHCRQ